MFKYSKIICIVFLNNIVIWVNIEFFRNIVNKLSNKTTKNMRWESFRYSWKGRNVIAGLKSQGGGGGYWSSGNKMCIVSHVLMAALLNAVLYHRVYSHYQNWDLRVEISNAFVPNTTKMRPESLNSQNSKEFV